MVAISDKDRQHKQAWQPLRAAPKAMDHVLHALLQLLTVNATEDSPCTPTPQGLIFEDTHIKQQQSKSLKTAVLRMCLQVWFWKVAKQALLSATPPHLTVKGD